MLDAYEFVRLVTFSMALVWSVRGVVRTVYFLHRWESRLDSWGVRRAYLRRAALGFVLRTTVLDPINLALMLTLVAIWTFRWTL